MPALQRVDRNKTSRPGIFKMAPEMILKIETFKIFSGFKKNFKIEIKYLLPCLLL